MPLADPAVAWQGPERHSVLPGIPVVAFFLLVGGGLEWLRRELDGRAAVRFNDSIG